MNGENDHKAHVNGDENDCHRKDEQLNVCLECNGQQLKALKRRFLRLSCHATVTHLKKFVALKLYKNLDKFRDVSMSYATW